MFQEFSMADSVMYKPVDLPDLVQHIGEAIASTPPRQ